MYRDIKPENIGFDVRGDIKIFDFGLAREFDPTQRDKDGLFQMTEDTGSPRYMDPLVALGKPYNELSDVYSFCILLWQMLELAVPFEGYSMSLFNKKVLLDGARPMINESWSPEIKKMIRAGFGDISQRPTMAQVRATLHMEISRCSDGDVHDPSAEMDRKSVASQKGSTVSL